MTTETPPDWVLLEAARLCDWDSVPEIESLRRLYRNVNTFRALCDMIQQHEAFKQEVSDVVFDYFQTESDAATFAFIREHLDRIADFHVSDNSYRNEMMLQDAIASAQAALDQIERTQRP